MENGSPGDPAVSNADLLGTSFDQSGLPENADVTTAFSTPQRLQTDIPDWLTWEESSSQSSAAYIVKLFRFW